MGGVFSLAGLNKNKSEGYKAGGEVEKENIHPETNEPTVEKRDFRKNQDNIEKVVDSLTSEENRLPSTGQPGSQFLIQLSQLGLYDVCLILYPDAELFTHKKWDKNKNRSAPISKSRIDQIWITHEPDDPDLHQDKRIVGIKRVNYEIQLGDEKSTDGEEIKCRFNELWDNIISAIYLGQMVLAH
ncbi:hypothetical protein RhiirA1_462161 [Rhizophagus irregularis]|uniref:Uncharacterized protein n=1 Tax=Rhizophagus irregularis TaxID=588596 RepID=A0A2N0RMS7_9GLOM|nr:hypothetical protein RhiirA1_462161 [Rhizophagus irregularis]